MKKISLLLLLLVIFQPAFASDYIGDFCFRAGTVENDTRLMKLGVSHMGGNHYLIAGTWNWEDGTGRSTPINGNIEAIGNNYEGTLTFSFYDSEYIYYRVAHLELDKSSLSGTNRMIKSRFAIATNTGKHSKSILPVIHVGCP